MVSNACKAAVLRSQKMRSERILQVRQLSIMSSPYGDSMLTPPCDAVRAGDLRRFAPAIGGHMARCQDGVTYITLQVSAPAKPLAVTSSTGKCDIAHTGQAPHAGLASAAFSGHTSKLSSRRSERL